MAPAEAQPESSEPAARPEPSAFQVAAWAAGGAAMGLVLPRTLFEASHKGELVQFGLAVLLGAVFINVVEPQLRRRMGAAHDEPSSGRPVRRTLLGALLTVPLYLLFELIHAGVSHDARLFLLAATLSLVTCGVVTYLWVRAARQRRPLAARDGALGGFIVGYTVPSLLALVTGGAALQGLTGDSVRLTDLTGPDAVVTALLILLSNAVNWAFWGLLGGIVIDGQWFRRPTLAVGVALLIGAAVPALFLSVTSPSDSVMLTGFLIQDFVRATGWGLGLFFCPVSDEAFRVERANPAALYVSGGVVALCALSATVGFTYRATPPILLQEDFKISDTTRLPTDFELREGCQRVFQEPGFIVRNVRSAQGRTSWCQVEHSRVFTSDVRIDLAARLRAGTGKARYGLKFGRTSDPVSYYMLLVSANGSYALWYYHPVLSDPPVDLLAKGKSVPAVNTRHGEVNRIQVVVNGSRIECFINEQQVCAEPGRADMAGRLALFLDGEAEVKFESLRVTAPPSSGPSLRPPSAQAAGLSPLTVYLAPPTWTGISLAAPTTPARRPS